MEDTKDDPSPSGIQFRGIRLNGVGPLCCPYLNARYLNFWFIEWLINNPNHQIGVIEADFPGALLLHLSIESNFPSPLKFKRIYELDLIENQHTLFPLNPYNSNDLAFIGRVWHKNQLLFGYYKRGTFFYRYNGFLMSTSDEQRFQIALSDEAVWLPLSKSGQLQFYPGFILLKTTLQVVALGRARVVETEQMGRQSRLPVHSVELGYVLNGEFYHERKAKRGKIHVESVEVLCHLAQNAIQIF